MRFLYDELAGMEILEIKGEAFNHLKARRNKAGHRLDIRNLKDGYSYIYEIQSFDRKAVCELVCKNLINETRSNLTLAWAVVEPSVIEKTLPSLNELGVDKILFVYSEFSQNNIRLDLARFERILIGSSQQCGRNDILKMEIYKSVDELLSQYSGVCLIDFGGACLEHAKSGEILFVGSEGGFSQSERQKLKTSYALKSPNILRSNTAIISVAAKVLA